MNILPLPSPNFDERNSPIDMLVMHYTGMPTAQAAKERLCDPAPGNRVSAHYLVEEDGTVYALVPEDKRAWHAGVSSWRGQENINSRSIGIEIVNPGHEYGYAPFPPAQMKAVTELAKAIVERHGIPAWNVVAHSDIAPSRKEDPGELFDWKGLAAQGVGMVPPAPAEKPQDDGLLGWVMKLFSPSSDASLKPGQRGDNVREMQEGLAKFGYKIDICSIYGPDTLSVATAFQRHFRPSKVDGVWDAECKAALNALLQKVPSATVPSPDGRTAAGLP